MIQRYGQPAHPETGDVQPDRDDMEFRLLKRFHEARRAVLGIAYPAASFGTSGGPGWWVMRLKKSR